jgi:hypothetical protein
LELGMTLEQTRQPPPEHRGGPASKPRLRFEGTPSYLAPEIILAFLQQRTTPATLASDMFSAGVTLNEIATCSVPYADATARADQWRQHTVIETRYSPNQFYHAVCRADDPLRPNPPAGPAAGPADAAEAPAIAAVAALARACWAHDAAQRPPAADVLAALDAAVAAARLDLSPAARRGFAAEAAALAHALAAPEPTRAEPPDATGPAPTHAHGTAPAAPGGGGGGVDAVQPATTGEDAWPGLIRRFAGLGGEAGPAGAGGPAVHAAGDGLTGRREAMEDRQGARVAAVRRERKAGPGGARALNGSTEWQAMGRGR